MEIKNDLPWENSEVIEKPKFKCEACDGTGKWIPRTVTNPTGSIYWNDRGFKKCFKCNGTGFMKTSFQDRQKAAQQRRARKERDAVSNLEEFKSDNAELYNFLENSKSWNDFSKSLLGSISKYGSLTDNQLAAAERMMAKCNAKAKQRNSNSVEMDHSKINEAFAKQTTRAKPFLNAGDVQFSSAPASGVNEGAIYVKIAGEYQGKLIDGKFFATVTTHIDQIREACSSPLELAKAHGRKSGTCCQCSRELTNPDSIKAGIGPICAGAF